MECELENLKKKSTFGLTPTGNSSFRLQRMKEFVKRGKIMMYFPKGTGIPATSRFCYNFLGMLPFSLSL